MLKVTSFEVLKNKKDKNLYLIEENQNRNSSKFKDKKDKTMENLKEKVEKALNEIRPFLQSDGGDISLIGLEEDGKVVKVRLEGTCVSCTINQMTLRSGVEMTIKKYAPEVEKVINIE